MMIDELPDIVYHGTISIHKESLIHGIDISKGFKSADFGQGFYTTGNYEQAKALAIDRAKAYNKRYKNKPTVKPMVAEYLLNKIELINHKGLIFNLPDDRWKEFVYNNRVGNDFSVSSYYNKNGKYNFVYGCVADSNITEMVGNIKRERITYADFIDNLKPLKQQSYNQLSFHTNNVVSVLELLKFEIIEWEAILNG